MSDLPPVSGSAPEEALREGLRERKKQATRKALSQAAMRLAIQHGLDALLVEDIAAEAGVSPRTFNNYFASKYEAICATALDRSREIGAALRARPDGEPLWDAITAAVLQVHSAADRAPDPDWIAGLRAVIRSHELQGEYLKSHYMMQRSLTAAIAERTGTDPAADMLPRVLAGAVAAAVQVAMERWLFADPAVALAPLMATALHTLAGALPQAAAAGRAGRTPVAAGDGVPEAGPGAAGPGSCRPAAGTPGPLPAPA
jgi:AcrR family transcriptional regulator